MSKRPPKSITRLLSKLCKPTLWEAIEGDLYELFLIEIKKKGLKRARRSYFWNALAFLRYHRLQKVSDTKTQNNMSLLSNYMKVSWRDLTRNKTFSAINLIGLVSGMTIFLLIMQYVLFENSFDTFHKDVDRIYRVINDRYQNGELVQRGMITYPTVGKLLKEDFPEIESYTRMTYNLRNYLQFDGETHLINKFLLADEHFLTFFDFPLLIGDPKSALDGPFQIALTESYAKKLTKSKDVSLLIDETITLYGVPCKITAIAKDAPNNSHLQFDLLVSYKTFIATAGEEADNSMSWSDFYHYVKLKNGVDKKVIHNKLAEFGKRHFKDGEVSGAIEEFSFQPLLEARMDNTLEYEIGDVTDGSVVSLILVIGLFILMIAWINYINLTTSRAIQRAKEVGIRKSIGCSKSQLIWQFVVETGLINGIALGISVVLVLILQPYFNALTELQLGLDILLSTSIANIPTLLFLAGSLILIIILVAIHPSLVTSRFTTQEVLKGSFKMKGEIVWLRKGLVVFQFSIAVIFITGVLVVNKQIDYMVNKDLGIDIDKNLVIYGPASFQFDSTLIPTIDSYKNELLSLSGVDKVATTSRVAGRKTGRIFHVRSLDNPELDNLTTNFINADHEYTEVFGLKVLAGRDLDITDHNSDGNLVRNIIVNESAVQLLGYRHPTEAINTRVNFFGKNWIIIGVVNDFHQRSLHEPIEPIFILPYYENQQSFALKISGDPQRLLHEIREIFLKHFPGNYFDYYFLKDKYQESYLAEFRLADVSKVFAFFSILVATLGLYGLVMITLLKKTKEIGVRKVLGANLRQLLFLVNKDFLTLILIATLIGTPVAFLGLQKWKAGFAYSTDIGISVLIFASVALMVICLITISFHVGKVIRNNPVDSLRNE
ncbi:MAG: FtsX-like permease family protein [Bacteroidota bacterium]